MLVRFAVGEPVTGVIRKSRPCFLHLQLPQFANPRGGLSDCDAPLAVLKKKKKRELL